MKKTGFTSFFRFDLKSIQGRGTWAFILLIVHSITFFIINNYIWKKATEERQALIEVVYPVEFYSLELLNRIERTQINLHQYILLGDEKYQSNNRKIWLVDIPAYKDSLYFYVNQSENEEAKVAYVTVSKHLVTLKQFQERSRIAYATIKDDKIWKKILEDDLAFEIDKIQAAVEELVNIEKERKAILEEELNAKIERNQNIVFISLSVGYIIAFFVSFFLIGNIIQKTSDIRHRIKILIEGNFPEDAKIQKNEFRGIESDIVLLKKQLISLKAYANSVGEGEFDTNLLEMNKDSELGKSLFLMGKNLKEVYEDDRQRSWVTEGLAKFADLLRTHSDSIDNLCREVINELVKHLGILQGGFFVVKKEDNEENTFFHLQSTYAYGKEKFFKKNVSVHEGLLGRVYKEKEMVHISNIPEGYMQITSGLGEVPPKSLLILPLEYEHRIEGAIELASLRAFQDYELRFLNQLSEIVASTLSAAINSQKNRELLQEAQGLASKFQAQETELRLKTTQLDKANREAQTRLTAVEREQTKFKAILDTMVDAVIVSDFRGRIEFFNNAAELMFGYKEEELLGKNVSILMPTSYSTDHDKHMKRYVNTNESQVIGKGREITGLTKIGKQVQMHLSLSDVRIGKNLWFTAVIRKA